MQRNNCRAHQIGSVENETRHTQANRFFMISSIKLKRKSGSRLMHRSRPWTWWEAWVICTYCKTRIQSFASHDHMPGIRDNKYLHSLSTVKSICALIDWLVDRLIDFPSIRSCARHVHPFQIEQPVDLMLFEYLNPRTFSFGNTVFLIFWIGFNS